MLLEIAALTNAQRAQTKRIYVLRRGGVAKTTKCSRREKKKGEKRKRKKKKRRVGQVDEWWSG